MRMPLRSGRYFVIFGAALALLAGCSSDGERQRDMRTAWHHFVPFTGAAPVSPGYRALEAAGTPVLMLRETGSGHSLALRRVPGQGAGGVVSWRAPAGSEYDFLNGVLVATRGLPQDLVSVDVSALLARIDSGQGGRADRFESRLDGDGQVVIAAYVCDVTITAARVRESCTGPRDRFVNSYATGTGSAMAGSVQRIAPGTGATFSMRGGE